MNTLQSIKNNITFKLSYKICPFLAKSRTTKEIVNDLLKDMKL